MRVPVLRLQPFPLNPPPPHQPPCRPHFFVSHPECPGHTSGPDPFRFPPDSSFCLLFFFSQPKLACLREKGEGLLRPDEAEECFLVLFSFPGLSNPCSLVTTESRSASMPLPISPTFLPFPRMAFFTSPASDCLLQAAQRFPTIRD